MGKQADWERETMTANDRAEGTSSRDVPARSAANSGGDTALETRNLSREVMGKVLVNDISVQVQQGQILAVGGASGAGEKSVLLFVLLLGRPTTGAVVLSRPGD